MSVAAAGPELHHVPTADNLLTPLQRWGVERPAHPVAAIRVGSRFTDISAGQLWDDVQHYAKGLMAMGIARGDRVALMSATSLAWLELDHAIVAIGAITVPVYETSSPDQAAWILEDTEAKLVLVAPSSLDAVVEARQRSSKPSGSDLFVIDAAGLSELRQRSTSVSDAAFHQRMGTIRSDDMASIIYTSGTTGRPKGCMLSHGNLRANVFQVRNALGTAVGSDDTALLFLPLAHVLSKITALYCLELGAKIAFGTGIAALSEEMEMVKPTVISAVPRVFEKVYAKAQHNARSKRMGAIFDRAARVAIGFSREQQRGAVSIGLRMEHWLFDALVYRKIAGAFGGRLHLAFCGGAPLGEHLTSFFDGIGVRIYEGYGLTETSPILTMNRSDHWQPGSVGLAVAGTLLRLREDSELMAQGPQVFQGYWRNPEATRAVMDEDGWFRTGDLAQIDRSGAVRITGRCKDIIVTAAGKNVAPAPIEDLLRPHPLISQAMVIGDGRPFVAALLTLDEDGVRDWAKEYQLLDSQPTDLVESAALRADLQVVIDRANASVSRAESIRKFVILPHDFTMESGEVTPTLKIKRALVLSEYADVIESLYSNRTNE